MDPTIRLLRELISVDSVNPSLVRGAAGEAAIARVLLEELRGIGLHVDVQDAAPGRPNVIGTLEGREPGRSMMFCGHTDTVGVAGMPRPFVPEAREGRLHGRGSQDMKGGVAAMIGAARVIAESGGLDAGRLVIACVADEEHASIGADALVAKWRADGAVVTEPTDLAVAVAHKGFEWVEVTTEGRRAHGSRPDEGRDAILQMGRVLAALEDLDSDLQRKTPHALLGTASLHASLIEGGHELSSYPDLCRLQMERRTLPGEPLGCAGREVARILDGLREQDPELVASSRAIFARAPYETAPDHSVPVGLVAAAAGIGCEAPLVGMSYWTDAAVLGGAGIPSVLFGPTGAGLHSLDEWVDLQSVLTCRDALALFARNWCRA